MLIILILVIGITIVAGKFQQKGIREGMEKAETNCLEFICRITKQCTTIEKLTTAQNICKSYIYNTDFYVENKLNG